MKQFFRLYGLYIFALVALIDLGAITGHYEAVHRFTKPLLMPMLLLTVLCTENKPGKWLLLTGLFFSFLGDVFLLFDSRYPIFFIFGLLSFLVTHVFYIIYFLKIPVTAPSLFKRRPLLLLPILLYIGTLLWLLVPRLGALQLPVIVYSLVLGFMLVCSLHIAHRVTRYTAVFFAFGAVLFVVSDSLLAINRFYYALPASGFLVMSSYCAAQAFIVKGFLLRK